MAELQYIFWFIFFGTQMPEKMAISETTLGDVEVLVGQIVHEMENCAFRNSPYRITGASDESDKFGASQKATGATRIIERQLFPPGLDPEQMTKFEPHFTVVSMMAMPNSDSQTLAQHNMQLMRDTLGDSTLNPTTSNPTTVVTHPSPC